NAVYVGSQSGRLHAVSRGSTGTASALPGWPLTLPTSYLRFTPLVNSHHIVITGGASSGLFGVDPKGGPGGTPTTKWSYGRPHSSCTAYNEGFETGGLLVG